MRLRWVSHKFVISEKGWKIYIYTKSWLYWEFKLKFLWFYFIRKNKYSKNFNFYSDLSICRYKVFIELFEYLHQLSIQILLFSTTKQHSIFRLSTTTRKRDTFFKHIVSNNLSAIPISAIEHPWTSKNKNRTPRSKNPNKKRQDDTSYAHHTPHTNPIIQTNNCCVWAPKHRGSKGERRPFRRPFDDRYRPRLEPHTKKWRENPVATITKSP